MKIFYRSSTETASKEEFVSKEETKIVCVSRIKKTISKISYIAC